MKKYAYKKTKGFTLVVTVFILVVLGLLTSFIISIFIGTKKSNVNLLLATRAYYATVSGNEWALKYVEENSMCPTSDQIFTFDQEGLKDFQVKVICSEDSFFENPNQKITIYKIRSIGKIDGMSVSDENYVRRTTQVIAITKETI